MIRRCFECNRIIGIQDVLQMNVICPDCEKIINNKKKQVAENLIIVIEKELLK